MRVFICHGSDVSSRELHISEDLDFKIRTAASVRFEAVDPRHRGRVGHLDLGQIDRGKYILNFKKLPFNIKSENRIAATEARERERVCVCVCVCARACASYLAEIQTQIMKFAVTVFAFWFYKLEKGTACLQTCTGRKNGQLNLYTKTASSP
jgi:hypothetical protein